jgi:hypothetical protein
MFVLCAFILCLCCPVRACDGQIPYPRFPTVCVKKITKLKKRPMPSY